MATTDVAESPQQDRTIRLSERVRVARRFLRSVNLERDFYTPDALDGYVLTPAAVGTLDRLASGLTQVSARAWSLTGSYGTGKSAFALMATKALALSPIGDAGLRERLHRQHPETAVRLPQGDAGFWPVLVTGAREPLLRGLLRGLRQSLTHLPDAVAARVLENLAAEFPAPWEEDGRTGRDLSTLVETLSRLLRASLPNCAGLMIVVDEMGKFLEYAALHPERGDMQALQDVAEAASRSAAHPVLFVTILHQAFEEYGHRLSSVQRVEWQKVQGRFVDIPYGDGPEETLRMLAQALDHTPDSAGDALIEQTVQAALDPCRIMRLFPTSMSASEFQELLRRIYPLHPLVGLVLPYVFRRFGQNERSLFSFLSSDEPHGFQDFLRTHALAPGHAPQFRMDHLYDYLVQTLGSSLYSHPTARLWSEAEEMVHRLRERPPLQMRLVKTIGLLSVIGDQARVLPSNPALVYALAGEGITDSQIKDALTALQTGTFITYRNFKKAYRLYQGSDIDVEARLLEARAQLARATDSVKVAHVFGATPPIVARRHSYETGTLRYFEVRCCRPDDLALEVRAGHTNADGLLVLCLALDASELARAQETAAELLADRTDVILGLNVETPALHEAATYVESLHWVQGNTPELRTDTVARREVEERLSDATAAFQAEWERLLRPQNIGDDGGLWLYRGQTVPLTSYRHLQELVSRACAETYPFTPILRNELINRRQISSTSAAARRTLIERMIDRRTEPRLGMEGFPAEYSMYVSVLENTGIHRRTEGGGYDFQPPLPERGPALVQVWSEIESFLFTGTLQTRPLTVLFDLLRDTPYGLSDGILPVLLAAVLLYHQDEVVVYEEGRFITELDTATYERLIKRPENFALQGCRVAGERQAVLERFGRGVIRPGQELTLVNVVRELYRQFSRFPEYTLKTRSISEEAQRLRGVFKEGKQPEQLLFVQIPQALGVNPLRADEADTANVETLFVRWNETMAAIVGAYGALLDRIERVTATTLGMADWEDVRSRALAIRPFVTEQRLRAFVLRAADETLDRQRWMESVAASVVGRPPSTWSDVDEDKFVNLLPTLGSAFKHSELLWFERNEKSADEEHVGVRLTITEETGAEEASIAVVPKAEAKTIANLTHQCMLLIETVLKGKSHDLRVAVISEIAKEVLRGNENE